jgi:cytochrome P450
MSVTESSAVRPASDIDLYAPECLRDPYPYYTALRAIGPVVRMRKYGVWAVTRYTEVTTVLKDYETYCSSGGASIRNYFKEKPWRRPSLLLEADPPLHTRTRAVLTRILSPAALSALRDAFAEEADALVSSLVRRGEFDAVRDLGEVFPVKVFPDALGLDSEGREQLALYGRMVVSGFGPREKVPEDLAPHVERVQAWVAQKCSREALRPGSFGAKVYEAADAGELTEDEAPLLVRSFLSAGLDTSMRALAHALQCLMQFPDQWVLLRSRPELARAAFEEMLRYHSPAQAVWRTTTRATQLCGIDIDKHEKVVALIGSANRDPARWEDPDRYDISRKTVGHVGLGHGIHACVGQAVARLEGEVILNAFARHASRLEPAGDPQYGRGIEARAVKRLPIRVMPAS